MISVSLDSLEEVCYLIVLLTIVLLLRWYELNHLNVHNYYYCRKSCIREGFRSLILESNEYS